MRRISFTLSILAAFLAVALSPHVTGADTEAERERDRVREEKARVAANVDVLNADKAEIDAALADLEAQVQAEEQALASAEREVADAEEAERRAQAGIDDTEVELRSLEDRLRLQMVETYTDPNGQNMASVLDADTATDLVMRRAILQGQTAEDEDLADQVRAARNELQAQRRAAAAARVRAEEKRAEVQVRLDRVSDARNQQQSFVEQVQSRINAELERAIELGNRDKELSAQIAEEQAQLQALLAYQAAQKVEPDPGPTYGDGGTEAAPIAVPGGGGGGPVGSGTGGIPLCNASGITVHCSIQQNVIDMISAAAADGVTLTGSGYRDPARQIALREEHCGSSYYAIYQMPSSQCRPPTARPGSSQHEVGLAIDFQQYSFSWLSANASRFGFYNLPSESWHWSTTGN